MTRLNLHPSSAYECLLNEQRKFNGLRCWIPLPSPGKQGIARDEEFSLPQTKRYESHATLLCPSACAARTQTPAISELKQLRLSKLKSQPVCLEQTGWKAHALVPGRKYQSELV